MTPAFSNDNSNETLCPAFNVPKSFSPMKSSEIAPAVTSSKERKAS